VQEVLGNIVKHSNASNIEMSVSSIDGLININLEDDSTNFDLKSGNGIGLQTIKSRLSLINGKNEAFKTPQGAVYHIEARPQN
jgi:signal transduction histidine kinase